MNHTKENIAPIFSDSGADNCSTGTSTSTTLAKKKKGKLVFFSIFFSFLFLFSAFLMVVAFVERNSDNEINGGDIDKIAAHPIIKSSCSSTLYPELCFSSMSKVSGAADKIKSPKDVVELSLNLTITSVQQNYFTIKKIISIGKSKKALTKRELTALHDCLELVDETLDELFKSQQDLKDNTSSASNKTTISQHAEHIKTMLSGAMTNQETCLDGFSHDSADKKVREALIAGQMHVFHMCSNALAMIRNITDSEEGDDMANQYSPEGNGKEWPDWLSAGDRRLLQAPTLTPNVVVAADGSGDYKTVSEAVAAAPEGSSTRYIIKIKAGVYRENVEVPKKKTNLMFVGDGRVNTIITGNRNVVDGSTTFRSATVAVVGDRFLARDITFENTAGPSKHQAVALRVGSDLSAFYQCDMLAYQDTLYVHSLRQFFVNCFIAGSVDFIFGNAAAILQDCDIHARRPNPGQKNMVTAQGREDPNQNTGIVIQKCRIGATKDLLAVQSSFPTYLGRPWKLYSRTIVMQSDISDVINPAGWFMWDGNFALDTLTYREYKNTGAGAGTANRVTWKGFKVVTNPAEVEPFTAERFIAGSSWLRSTGFPFFLGL
ncbi:hypothetical protein FEM48_Zijuj08G0028100 [Ziziphus jujuba var. spinosa]|uniref:Pectinesterase n=1 Tax=Ziziphus jujuba var. spinosa TaxID=714518 RepID=A0A978UWJ7_ZIZJJ|nr:hypothetical protein FEM48_Zijuj08G0028100 [Ziziphus jujuba var. spinosa]